MQGYERALERANRELQEADKRNEDLLEKQEQAAGLEVPVRDSLQNADRVKKNVFLCSSTIFSIDLRTRGIKKKHVWYKFMSSIWTPGGHCAVGLPCYL